MTLTPKGLFTYYNSLADISPGALLKANNIVIQQNGVAQPRRGIKYWSDTFGVDADRAKQLFEYKSRILCHYNNKDTKEHHVMRTPTVHLNGTSREELEKQQMNVYNASRKLLEALACASPHARDYYVQDDMAAIEASREYSARFDAVAKIHNEAMEMLIAIQKA